MATYYNDLASAGTGHAGTSGDPFSAPDFFSHVNGATVNPGDVYKLKGEYTDSGNFYYISPLVDNLTFEPWDAVTFGPWRINFSSASQDVYILTAGQNHVMKGGILFVSASADDMNVGNAGVEFDTMVFDAPDDFRLNGNTAGTCTFRGCSTNGRFRPETQSSALTYNFINCTINAPSILTGDQPGGLNFTNCVLTLTLATWQGFTNFSQSNCQFEWSAPAWPAWDDPQASWNSDTLAASVTTPPQPGVTPYTNHETGLWGNARTGIGSFYFPLIVLPSWESTYPKTGNITGTTAEFLLKTDTDSTGYFVVLSDGASAPSSAQVKAGTDADGTAVAAGFSGSRALDATVEGSATATNLTGGVSGTVYDSYLVAENDAGLQASPVLVDFTTSIDIPSWISTYPKAGTVAGNTAQFLFKTNIDSTAYFVVVPDGASAPSSTQVKAGQNADGTAVAAGFSGNTALIANVEGNSSASSLISETAYDAYAVSEASGGLQASPSKIDFTTTDITGPVWSTDYPTVEVDGTTATIYFSTNEAGNAYFVIDNSSPAPSSAQVKAGQNGSGASVDASLKGNTALTANTQASVTVTGMEAGKSYACYAVAEDSTPNLQSSPEELTIETDEAGKIRTRSGRNYIIGPSGRRFSEVWEWILDKATNRPVGRRRRREF